MIDKIITFVIYLVAITSCCYLSVEIGSELIAIYEMHSLGLQRYELANDMAFGILLFLGLIPELAVGLILGSKTGKILNKYRAKRT